MSLSSADLAGAVPAQRAGSNPVEPGTDLVRYVQVGRQGIYDGRRSLTAYELQFRSPVHAVQDPVADGVQLETAAEQATSHVIASTLGTFGLDTISDGRDVFITITRAFLTGEVPIPVPPGEVVLWVDAAIAEDPALLDGARRLRQQGHRLAVGGYAGEPGRGALLELAEVVGIDVCRLSPEVVGEASQQAGMSGARLLAREVPDAVTMQRCHELGFALFHGPYLQRPTVLEQRTLSPSQLVCARLLSDLVDPDVPMSRIESLVGSDPGLTVRMLRTVNSGQAGAGREVTSLRQALVLIGPRLLRSWVVLTLLEGGTSVNTADDLWSVLARAFTCQRLAAATDAGLAFTIGLLSGAADLLGTDPDSVATAAGIGRAARAAMLEGTGPAGRVLSAVLGHERNDPAAILAAGLVPFDVSRAYLESLSESIALVHELMLA